MTAWRGRFRGGHAHDVRRALLDGRRGRRSRGEADRRGGVGPPQQRGEGRGVRPGTRVGGERRLDRRDQRAGCVRGEQPQRCPLAGHRCAEDRRCADAVVRRGAGEQVVADRGEGPDVCSRIRFTACCDRRVDVLSGAVDGRELLTRQPRDTEVGQHRHALGGEQHVGRRDVAVHQTGRVRRRQARRQGGGHGDDLTWVERSATRQQGGQ